jgi:hypothetical protein
MHVLIALFPPRPLGWLAIEFGCVIDALVDALACQKQSTPN